MGRKKLTYSFVLFLVWGLAGCVSPTLIRLGHHEYPPKPADCDIKIFIGEKSIPHSYVEVCIFSYGEGTLENPRDSEDFASGINNPRFVVHETSIDESITHPLNSAEAAAYACKSQACKAGCDAIVIENADTDGVDLNPAGRKKGRMSVIKGIKFFDPPAKPQTMDSDQIIY